MEPERTRSNARTDVKMKIIGLCGAVGSGKDETAKCLVASRRFTRIALADPIRELLEALDPIIEPYKAGRLSYALKRLGWDGAKREYPEIRRLMQELGHNGRSILAPAPWLRVAKRKLDAALKAGSPGVVVTDCRYDDEAEWIRSVGGSNVEILRHNNPHKLTGKAAKHATEKRSFKADWKVENNSTTEALNKAIVALVDSVEENPTPAEIRQTAAAIRATWTPQRERESCQYPAIPYELPEVALVSHDDRTDLD